MAGWHPGDPIGKRQFAPLFADTPLTLEGGKRFGPITLAYESWGELNPTRSNAIVLLHGFTGDSHAAGPVEPGHPEAGWWDGLIGPDRPLDTNSFSWARRFDANSYIALTKAMSHHDVVRGRGGVEAALARVQDRTRIVSI